MEPLPLADDDIDRIEALTESGAADLLELVENLPEDQRRALKARVIEERPYDEIAAQMRCSPAVIRKRVSRAVATLRREIGEEAS